MDVHIQSVQSVCSQKIQDGTQGPVSVGNQVPSQMMPE